MTTKTIHYIPQVRISKTEEIQIALEDLKDEFSLMSDAEMFKMGLSLLHKEYSKKRKQRVARTLEKLSDKGSAYGENFLTSKGLKQEELSDEELVNLVKNA